MITNGLLYSEADQINRNKADEDPIPTAEWTYKNNLNISSVADSAVKRIIPSPVKMKTGSGSAECHQ